MEQKPQPDRLPKGFFVDPQLPEKWTDKDLAKLTRGTTAKQLPVLRKPQTKT